MTIFDVLGLVASIYALLPPIVSVGSQLCRHSLRLIQLAPYRLVRSRRYQELEEAEEVLRVLVGELNTPLVEAREKVK